MATTLVDQFRRAPQADRCQALEALALEFRDQFPALMRRDGLPPVQSPEKQVEEMIRQLETPEELAEDERRFRDGPFVDADDMMDAVFGRDMATAARQAVDQLS